MKAVTTAAAVTASLAALAIAPASAHAAPAVASRGGGMAAHPATATAAAPRHVPGPLYGVTVDQVTNLGAIAASSEHLSHMHTTRIYFDVKHGPGYYLPAAVRLHRVSYLMGELLDSSDETKITVTAFGSRVESYLRTSGATSISGRSATRSTATGPGGTRTCPQN